MIEWAVVDSKRPLRGSHDEVLRVSLRNRIVLQALFDFARPCERIDVDELEGAFSGRLISECRGVGIEVCFENTELLLGPLSSEPWV